MNMMWSPIQLPGYACAYIKKLTNFQKKNSHDYQISKKKIGNREILLPTISLKMSLKIA